MKASRAPGAVQSTYVQLHQQRQRENKTGVSNKSVLEKGLKKGEKQGSHAGNGGGGVLNQFKSLDDIPDFPMDENISWGDSNHSYRHNPVQPVRFHPQQSEEDEVDYYNRYNQPFQESQYKQSTEYSRQLHSKPPPPLPATLQNPRQGNHSYDPSYDYRPQKEVGGVAIQSEQYPPSSYRHHQQYHSHEDSSDDNDEGEDEYYQNKESYLKAKHNPHDQPDIHSIAVPKKKKDIATTTTTASFSRKESVGPTAQGFENPPPPLPCEQPTAPLSPVKVIPEHEKLFFSKEPRTVDYKPYTLQQYKMIKPKEYIEISKMKPDLNTEELVEKRKRLEKIKEFSKHLRQVNQETFLNQSKLPSSTEQADLLLSKKKYESTRIRAKEYARQIPKPKLSTPITEEDEEREVKSSRAADGGGLYMDEDAFQAAKLQELEAKHLQGKARLEAIKKSISQK